MNDPLLTQIQRIWPPQSGLSMGSGMNYSGDIPGCVVLSREGVYGFSSSYPAAFLHAFVGQRRVM